MPDSPREKVIHDLRDKIVVLVPESGMAVAWNKDGTPFKRYVLVEEEKPDA